MEVTIAINDNLSLGSHFIGTPAHITIQTGSTRIPDHMFDNCDATKGITIPETVTYIGSFAFYECAADISITLPASLNAIGNSAFWYCKCDLVFASGTTGIPHEILYRSDVRHITIPISVTRLYKRSFESCYLLSITYEGTQEQWAAIVKDNGWWEDALLPSSVIHCTDGDVTL